MARHDHERLSASEGRRFALTMGAAFAVLALLALWRQHTGIAGALLAVTGLWALAALLLPTRLGPVQRGWMRFGHRLSKITTPIILAIIYFGVIMPVGLLRRLVSDNPVKRPRAADTYWVQRGEGKRRSDLTRLF